MGELQPEKRLEELSAEGVFALMYSLAFLKPDPWKRRFYKTLADMNAAGHKLSENDQKRAIQKGLNELFEKGWIALTKNGEGQYEPAQVNVHVRGYSGLVLREGA